MNEVRLRKLDPRKQRGLVVVISGNGKGKTTAALGMLLRAVGHGMKVCLIHFIKGKMYSGEYDGLKLLAPLVEHHIMGKGFYRMPGNSHSHREHREAAQEAIELAKRKVVSGQFDVVICDEINNALDLKLVDPPQVIDLIESKPERVHLILTGRGANPEVIARADTVSEIQEIKHAIRQGVEPQKGIDY